MSPVKGKGCELTSSDGDVYVDFLGEYTAGIYGHSNEQISSAISDALKDGWNYGGPNVYERQLAQKVCLKFRLCLVLLLWFLYSYLTGERTVFPIRGRSRPFYKLWNRSKHNGYCYRSSIDRP